MNNDQQLIRELFITQHDRIAKYVSLRVRNKHDADDLCQEIFYLAAKNIKTLRDKRKTVAWLYGISANVIKMYYHQIYKKEHRNIPNPGP